MFAYRIFSQWVPETGRRVDKMDAVMVRVSHYLRCCKDVCKELGLLTVEELVQFQYSSPNNIERT